MFLLGEVQLLGQSFMINFAFSTLEQKEIYLQRITFETPWNSPSGATAFPRPTEQTLLQLLCFRQPKFSFHGSQVGTDRQTDVQPHRMPLIRWLLGRCHPQLPGEPFSLPQSAHAQAASLISQSEQRGTEGRISHSMFLSCSINPL